MCFDPHNNCGLYSQLQFEDIAAAVVEVLSPLPQEIVLKVASYLHSRSYKAVSCNLIPYFQTDKTLEALRSVESVAWYREKTRDGLDVADVYTEQVLQQVMLFDYKHFMCMHLFFSERVAPLLTATRHNIDNPTRRDIDNQHSSRQRL